MSRRILLAERCQRNRGGLGQFARQGIPRSGNLIGVSGNLRGLLGGLVWHGRRQRRLLRNAHWRRLWRAKRNNYGIAIARYVIRRRSCQVHHNTRDIRLILAQADGHNRSRHSRNDGLVNSQPSAHKIQHQAIRVLHPGCPDVELPFAFHTHRRALRCLGYCDARYDRGFLCARGLHGLCRRRLCRQRQARKDQAAILEGSPIRLHCCSPELVE